MDFRIRVLELVKDIADLEKWTTGNPRTRAEILESVTKGNLLLSPLGELMVALHLQDQQDKLQAIYDKNREQLEQERIDQENAAYEEYRYDQEHAECQE